MSVDKDQLLMFQAQRYMETLGVRAVNLTLDLEIAIGMIGFVQLGLRHPEANRTPTAEMMRAFLNQLIGQIDPKCGPLYEILMRGFDEDFDVIRKPGP